jgi:hypothetical protein
MESIAAASLPSLKQFLMAVAAFAEQATKRGVRPANRRYEGAGERKVGAGKRTYVNGDE